jgi:hypothetical protein
VKAVVLVAAVLLAAPAAYGHEGGPPHGGYQATFSSVQPPILGLQVAVPEGDARLRIENLTGKTVEILAVGGQPFLRFTSDAVYGRAPGGGWEQVATGTTYDWAEPRIGWNRSSPPDAVAAEPGEIHFIRDWAIEGRADGVAFQIKGYLGWAPHAAGGSTAGADSADGRAFFIAFGLTAVAIAAAALFYVARRRTSSSSRSA